MSKVLFLFGICFVGFTALLPAQSPEHGFYLSFRTDNDVFVLPVKTDQYFTSGMELEFGREHLIASPLSIRQLATTKTYWRFVQHIFTPRNIEASQLLTNDRPYASYLTASRGRSYSDGALGIGVTSEWTFGILGKYSGGGMMQNALHKAVDFADPLDGWVHEIRPDIVINYRADLRRVLAGGPRAAVISHLEARLGTLFTDLTPGVILRLRVIQFSPSRSLDLEMTGDLKFVGYNATLSGGLINRDDRFRGVIKPERMVGAISLGGTLRFDGLQLNGGLQYLTPEFNGGLEHLWAWVGFRFAPRWQRATASRPSSHP